MGDTESRSRRPGPRLEPQPVYTGRGNRAPPLQRDEALCLISSSLYLSGKDLERSMGTTAGKAQARVVATLKPVRKEAACCNAGMRECSR